MSDGNRRVSDAIKHIRLDGCIVKHVFKNDFIAHLQRFRETPITHEIAGQTTVTTKTVGVGGIGHIGDFRSCHSGVIWHFETVGHVASETDIEDSGSDTFVFHDIHDMCIQVARLPSEGASWFQDDVQPRVSAMEPL